MTEPGTRQSIVPGMKHYRYVTGHRAGKWYPDLRTAQQQACAIGAGLLDRRTGMFYQYRDTMLEIAAEPHLATRLEVLAT